MAEKKKTVKKTAGIEDEDPPAVRALKVLFELLAKKEKNEDRKPVLLQEAL